jgi:hypothetical protein
MHISRCPPQTKDCRPCTPPPRPHPAPPPRHARGPAAAALCEIPSTRRGARRAPPLLRRGLCPSRVGGWPASAPVPAPPPLCPTAERGGPGSGTPPRPASPPPKRTCTTVFHDRPSLIPNPALFPFMRVRRPCLRSGARLWCARRHRLCGRLGAPRQPSPARCCCDGLSVLAVSTVNIGCMVCTGQSSMSFAAGRGSWAQGSCRAQGSSRRRPRRVAGRTYRPRPHLKRD